MSLHANNGLVKSIRHLLFLIFCFVLFYTFLIVFSIPIILLCLYRKLLSLVMYIRHGGKYQLLGSVDTICTIETPANLYSIFFFIYIDGPCDIEVLRNRVLNAFRKTTPSGWKPYGNFFKVAVQKFGFMWWEDKTDSFNINDHIRYFPESRDINKVIPEKEFLEATAIMADKLWPKTRPKWEILVTPKMKRDDNGVVGSVITMRFSHVYVDGISLVQVGRNCILDRPPKLNLDVVNFKVPPVPVFKRLLLFIPVFFLTPYLALEHMFLKQNYVYFEGPLTGPKFISRSKMEVPMEMIRRIRLSTKCCTMAVLNSAYCGALKTAAKRKGLPAPDEIFVGQVCAKLPYPDEYPRNNFYLVYEDFPIGIEDPFERLDAVDKTLKDLYSRYYAPIAYSFISSLTGIFPVPVVRHCFQQLQSCYILSNVPGVVEQSNFNEYPVATVWGLPPACNRMRYITGVGGYDSKFTFGFIFEESACVSTADELELFIQDFESQLKILDGQV